MLHNIAIPDSLAPNNLISQAKQAENSITAVFKELITHVVLNYVVTLSLLIWSVIVTRFREKFHRQVGVKTWWNDFYWRYPQWTQTILSAMLELARGKAGAILQLWLVDILGEIGALEITEVGPDFD